MKRRLALLTVVGLIFAAVALPAGAAGKATATYGLSGEARALEVALGDQGLTLGLALARADSSPLARGVGAGQCTLLGENPNPDDLPCTDETTVKSSSNAPTSPDSKCGGQLPEELAAVLILRVACGSSTSELTNGKPATHNSGKVAALKAKLPVGALLPDAPAEIDQLTDQLVGALQPILDQTPKEVRTAVEGILELLDNVAETELVAADIGTSSSNIVPKGDMIKVSSDSAGARIGLIGVPAVDVSGNAIAGTADPLENGLVIVEVGTAAASAAIDTDKATAQAAASPALVTVRVRDITQDEPTYIEQSVAPGETITVLENTPAESTITAADSTTDVDGGSARAAADAVRLHLLKGVEGGLKLGLARATAAAAVKSAVKPAPPLKKPEPLPVTGGTDLTWPAIGLIAAAGALSVIRRRFVR